ncbi:hypothetical protein [Phytopseudomonas seleniipraecipitans]|uniref:Uncharacterized protein n=1 Tax=Phytopseudomonas seleniipraecipitans TaxID=640205 RepID=A0A1G7RNG3_9GAMM|nr:hypothetical protein [Pseudomonas seleniipraecipitans]SDG12317.1 hypothetical protein SAMN05216381_3206 [Pseudomonas seleniipraecipitans]
MKKSSDEKRKGLVLGRIALLHAIIDAPHQYVSDEPVRIALSSQLAFSRYENPNMGICGCSLNSLKTQARNVGEGFNGMEKLRVAAHKAILAVKRSKKVPGSRRSLQEIKLTLEQKISSQDRDLLHLTLVIKELRELSLNLTKDFVVDKKLYYDSEIRRIDSMLRDWG